MNVASTLKETQGPTHIGKAAWRKSVKKTKAILKLRFCVVYQLFFLF